MRKVFVIGMTAATLAACSAGESTTPTGPSTPPIAQPGGPPTIFFEGIVDPVHETMQIVFRKPNGEVIMEPAESATSELVSGGVKPDAVGCTANFMASLPYATTGSASVYLHTKNVSWVEPNYFGGVCAMNLFNGPVCNWVTYIDKITISAPTAGRTMGLLATNAAPGDGGGGGKSTVWTGCASGTGVAGDPWIPSVSNPCHVAMGAGVNNSVSNLGAGILCSNVTPWVFNEAGPGSTNPAQGYPFTFSGYVSGDKPIN